MKKDVSLKIKSEQYLENLVPRGEAYVRDLTLDDSVEILTEGALYDKGNATYITYEESREAGFDDSRAVLKVRDGGLQIKRYGSNDDLTMDMQFEEGIMSVTRYKIPMVATYDLEVYTNKLTINLDEEGYGNINVDYKIKFDEFYSRRTKLDVEIRAN